MLKSINFLNAVACALSFLWLHFISFFMPKFKDDGSYKTWIVNRFGHKFYNIYFGPYSEKVWKIEPAQLSDIVAKKRIVVSGIIELIHSVIFKQQPCHPENPHIVDNYYPRAGVGVISDFFVKGIIDGGGEIIRESAVEKIVVDQHKVRRIYYSNNGQIKCLDFSKDIERYEHKVLSTIPVNEMIMMLEGNIPEDVVSAAKELDFTSEIFFYLNVKKTNVFDVPLLYFSEPEFPFNRIYDVGMFSRKMVPENRNALCLEISCDYNDQMWNANDDTLFDKCIIPIEKHGLLKRSEIESFYSRRLVHAYPRFRIGYKSKLKVIFDYLSNMSNLISFGRQGSFAYVNVDDAIWMGFEVAKNIGYGDRIGLSIKDLLVDYVSF